MILLVSNSRDFAVDYIVSTLRQRGLAYFRLDLDLVAADCVALDPISPSLTVTVDGNSIRLDPSNLRAV